MDEEPGRTTAEASSPAPGHRAEPQGGGGGGWAEESSRAAPLLLSLVTDPDALTRRHSCAALGNLGGVHGASGSGAPAATAGEADALRLLLAAACTDPHGGVRRTAIAALSAYSQREAQRQVIGPHVIDAMPA